MAHAAAPPAGFSPKQSTLSIAMKTILPFTALLLLSAAPVVAWPFTVRSLPAGFNGATVGAFDGALTDDRYDERPVAVDFLKNGRLQWYAGGTVISRYPESSSVITLPVITLPVYPAATVSPMAGTPCDVDGDGDMDIVRANKWNGHSFYYTLQVFRNNGSGGFSTGYRRDWEENLAYNEGEHYLQIVPGDFDKDGFTDLAIATRYENWEGGLGTGNTAPVWHGRLSINWNDGAGGFDAWSAVASSGYMPNSRVSTADVDRDGDTDIICDGHETWNEDDVYTDTTRLYVSNGDRTFTTVTRHYTTPVFFTDTDRDGWPDVQQCLHLAQQRQRRSARALLQWRHTGLLRFLRRRRCDRRWHPRPDFRGHDPHPLPARRRWRRLSRRYPHPGYTGRTACIHRRGGL
jgi:hypothetical protein